MAIKVKMLKSGLYEIKKDGNTVYQACTAETATTYLTKFRRSKNVINNLLNGKDPREAKVQHKMRCHRPPQNQHRHEMRA